MASRVQRIVNLRKKLARMPEAIKTEMRLAMEQGADEIVALAKNLVPFADGKLRDSIGWTWGDPPKGSIVLGSVKRSAGQRARQDAGLLITICAGNDEAYYARWVEFGTAQHRNGGMFAGTTHPGTNAQPFFYPAFRALRRRVKSRVTRHTNKAIKKVAAGG